MPEEVNQATRLVIEWYIKIHAKGVMEGFGPLKARRAIYNLMACRGKVKHGSEDFYQQARNLQLATGGFINQIIEAVVRRLEAEFLSEVIGDFFLSIDYEYIAYFFLYEYQPTPPSA